MVLLLMAVAAPALCQSDQYKGPDGARYWYSEGQWYRWGSGRWSPARAPVGLYVTYLPYYARMVQGNGGSYYYADQTYYVWNDTKRQFQVVATPTGIRPAVAVQPPRAPQGSQPPADARLFVYPANGQSAAQQQKDRDECARWAVGQSHYDPQAPGSAAGAEALQMHDAYLRAEASCLEARGYSVR